MTNYKFAIIGYPLSHSLSSVMQQAALKSCNLEGTYDVLETPSEDIIDRIKQLKRDGYYGFNVTIPHKVPITLFLSSFDEYANLANSVNTVKILDDKSLSGFNTDIYGFIKAIPEDFSVKNKKAAILGTGGAARAVCCAVGTLGAKEIDIYSRNILNSHEMAEILRNKFPEIKINLLQVETLKNLKDTHMLINTTPIGMKNFSQGVSPVDDEVIDSLPSDALVYDIVYNPIKTELIRQAIKFGRRYIGGLDMLVYQGAKAFEIWTGQMPDVAQMKIAALENLI